MRTVTYVDSRGYIRRALVHDADSDEQVPYGLPSGPPDLSQLDWPTIQREISNALASQGVFTWDDVQRIGLQAAWTVLKRQLVQLYRSPQQDYVGET